MSASRARPLVAYIQHRLEELRKKGKSDVEIAAVVGVTSMMVGHVRRAGRGIGNSEEGFAKLLAGGSLDRLRADARAWWEKNPDVHPKEELRIVYDDRYPNRAVAAEFARREGIPSAAIQEVLSHALYGKDLLPTEWFEEIKAVARRMKIESLKAPPTAAQKDEEEQQALDRLEKERPQESPKARMAKLAPARPPKRK